MRSSPISILLVEDNPGDARLILETLRDADSVAFKFNHVRRLDEVQGAIDRGVDVILLDLSLPDTDGIRTVQQALVLAPDIPIIVLTGLHDEDTALEAVHAGAQDFLVKGQTGGTELVRAMRYAIERASLHNAVTELVHLRDETLRVVAHDIGNALSAIGVHAKLAGRLIPAGESGSDALHHMEQIQHLVAHMQILRQDLLDAARIEAGQLVLECGPQDVEMLADEIVDRFEALASERAVQLESQVTEGLPPVHADAERILQVLANLVSNALKFTPAGGRVLIGAEPDGHGVCFSVIDNGPGIQEEHLPHLFNRFWQAPMARRAGSGLGLAIAKGIVEAHSGRIWVEQPESGGSAFRFTLPTTSVAAPSLPN